MVLPFNLVSASQSVKLFLRRKGGGDKPTQKDNRYQHHLDNFHRNHLCHINFPRLSRNNKTIRSETGHPSAARTENRKQVGLGISAFRC